MDRLFVLSGLGYALVGLALGIYMAASHDHSLMVVHAHIMLLGFLVSFVYGVCHRLWLVAPSPRIAKLQFYLHQAASLVLLVALFMLYTRIAPDAVLGPILGVSSVGVLIGMGLMKFMVIRAKAV